MNKHHIVFGGIDNFSKESLDVRINQINDKFRLHTCYFYGDALKVISKAVKETNIKPDLVVKLYYNYNFFYFNSKPKSNQFASCYDQLKTIIDELDFIPNDLHVQICCNVPFKNINSFEFIKFKKTVGKEFNVSKFFLETFPEWESNTKYIIKNNFLDGSIFHYNILEKGFFDEIFMNNKFIIISPLGGGAQLLNQIKSLKLNKYKKEIQDYVDFCQKITGYRNIVDLYIAFIKTLFLNSNFQYIITAVSSLENYNNLKIKFSDQDLSIKDEDMQNILLHKQRLPKKIYRGNPYGLYNFFYLIIKNRFRIKQTILSKFSSQHRKSFF
jgi:hypothetical protein